MKHSLPLGIKFLIIAIVFFSIFAAFDNATVWNVLVVSALFVVIGYFVGDLIILKRFGNLMATLADFGLAFLVLFFYGTFLNEPTWAVGNAALFSAFFVAMAEALYHFYLQNRVFGEPSYSDKDVHIRSLPERKLRVETSEEVFPYDVKRKREDKEED
ncbi:type III secretory pathway component EscS [Salirhabdus euzebyi]|uniref:Type III secretory pathway component EscS n=1 Tax=Salirhabdus euzebyi TaxID=394506 RepID=A0A841Q8I4_9BACI|nr:YndM family protein [Salirhabdus euzebyi]MBB6454633.1 type III secretory pathway component EscS [Salirhabdus euzebyi]